MNEMVRSIFLVLNKCTKYCKKKEGKRIGMKLVRHIFLDGIVKLNYC